MDNNCNSNRKWYLFILTEVGIYFGGLILILFSQLIKKCCCRKANRNEHGQKPGERKVHNKTDEFECLASLRLSVGELLSTQFFLGRQIILLTTLAAILSTGLYIYEISTVTSILERCDPISNRVYCVDLGCNSIFLLHFMLRFTAENGKVAFWFNILTIVDVLTVPQAFLSLYLSREWFGLRFLRIVSVTKLPVVLQNLKIVKSATSLRIVSLVTLFLTIWIGGAGFLHLLENSGDFSFQSTYKRSRELRFWDCLYFIVVTLSTVGYGDICAATFAGKVFITLFILVTLAVFASFLPELTEFIFSQSSYSGNYHKERGRKHVIVCGHINFDSVSTFLADFFHEDRSNTNVEVVFLNKDEPSEDLKGLLKSYLQVKYLQGTVMNHCDLERIQMNCADACLILANQNCLHPNEEDAGNTMRAISLKNYCHECPVIIQLLQFENKIYLENIPTWNRRNGDNIICYSEIELGILAQSCLVPGFSTLLTNLFSVRAAEACQHLSGNNNWLKNYMNGTTLEIYSAKLSTSFKNMSYKELVGFCLNKLNLLLIAIEVTDRKNNRTLLINPLNYTKIYSNTIGYFVCDSYKDANNASLYCIKCHSKTKNLKSLKKCKCKETDDGEIGEIVCREAVNETNLDEPFDSEDLRVNLLFHHCQRQDLQDCVIEDTDQANVLTDHIILCIFSGKESPLIGIRNFLMPLRSTIIPKQELKDVLIIADKDFLKNEWSEISCFPRLKVVFHSFSIRRMTHLLAIERCSRCVILNANSTFQDMNHDLYMVDKEIIIANLYFQATFRKNIKRQYSRLENATKNINTIIQFDEHKVTSVEMDSPGSKESEFSVPIISKLAIESNVQFLDVKETNTKKIPNYLRKPFAYGYVFTANMLDSLLSTAYFSPNAISIMEILITGGFNCDIKGEDSNEQILPNRIRIELVSVDEFLDIGNTNTTMYYGDLFVDALDTHNSLCLGLYRRRYLRLEFGNVGKIDRYVITNPPRDFLLDGSDMVYCLKQINESTTDK